MLNDLVAGHRLEAPWLCGRGRAAWRREAGLAAPVNATILRGAETVPRRRAALSLHTDGGIRMRLLLTWLINALALFALPYIFTSIHVDSFTTALIAALVLGLINTLIRPLLVLLTLPVTHR